MPRSRTYGFNPTLERQHRNPEKDHKFGVMSKPGLADISVEQRERYLPKGEVQQGKDDTVDCASRGPVNKYEAQLTFLYRTDGMSQEGKKFLDDNGYVVWRSGLPWIECSDAFIAILSGTTKEGNSLKAPCEAIRTRGLIPKQTLPLEKWMTFEQYHDPKRITAAMLTLGEECKNRFVFRYEQVFRPSFKTALQLDFIDVGVYAWPDPVNGEYPAIVAPFNHVVAMIRPEYYIFDNYVDSVDGDFIKKLAPNYIFFEYGYRLYILKEQTGAEIAAQRGMILNLLMQVLLLLQKHLASLRGIMQV